MSSRRNFDYRQDDVTFSWFVTLLGDSSNGLDEYLHETQCKNLVLNYAHGWTAQNLDFLKRLAWPIESLTVIAWTPLDLSPIETLRSLKDITLHCHSKATVDFGFFPYLERCALTWANGYLSIFASKQLKSLWVDHLNIENLEPISALIRLESLTLLNSKTRTLYGIENLQRLKEINISRSVKLKSLDSLWELLSLEVLELDGIFVTNPSNMARLKFLRKLRLTNIKGVEDLKFIGALTKLQWLGIDNFKIGVESLDFLKPLVNLETFFLLKTNVLDNDLSVILKLPEIKEVCIDFRKNFAPQKSVFNEHGLLI